jgi:hypothetical protein
MEHLYNIPVGEVVDLKKYVDDTYGEEKQTVVIGRLMSYLTGANGLLDLTFETSDGRLIDIIKIRKYLKDAKTIEKYMSVDGE